MVAKIISKDTALAEICLRRYEKPKAKGRELVRKFCLSIGLLQPGDSRDIIVDVPHVILASQKELNSEEIRYEATKARKKLKMPVKGVASSNIRRQLKRLKDLYIIETVDNNYRITENAPLSETFKEKTEGFLLNSVLSRVKDYVSALDKEFRK